MRASKSLIIKGAVAALLAAGTMMTSSAGAQSERTTYVVCNQYDECWKVHERLTTYPSDVQVVIHDDAWYQAHEHDTHWHWMAEPSDDHGWYDKDGAWHAFAGPPPEH